MEVSSDHGAWELSGCDVGGVRQGGSSRPAAVLARSGRGSSWNGGPQSSGLRCACPCAIICRQDNYCTTARRCSSPHFQRHGWACGHRTGSFAWSVRPSRRQSRVHSIISNHILGHPNPPPPSSCSPSCVVPTAHCPLSSAKQAHPVRLAIGPQTYPHCHGRGTMSAILSDRTTRRCVSRSHRKRRACNELVVPIPAGRPARSC